MPAFQRPYDPANLRASILTSAFSDSRDAPNGLQKFARYPNITQYFLTSTANIAGNQIQFRWPVSGAVRQVDLEPTAANLLGVQQLLELSPFPFEFMSLMRGMPSGLPTFYIGLDGAVLPGSDEVVHASDPSIAVTRVLLSCVFQDRLSLQPSAWINLIGNALTRFEPADAQSWLSLADLLDESSGIHVRDSAGQPISNEVFELRFSDGAGNTRVVSASSDVNGSLGNTSVARADEQTEIVWQARPGENDEALAVVVWYEGSITSPQNNRTRSHPDSPVLTIPAGITNPHVQVLDLARWYPPVSPPPGQTWPARFHADSLMEPLVDGIETFRRLYQDISQAEGVHMSGWAFDEFPLRQYDPTTSLEGMLDQFGRDNFRILVTQGFQAKISALDNAGTNSAALIAMLMAAAQPLIATKALGRMDVYGVLAWEAAILGIFMFELLRDPNASLENLLRKKLSFTEEDTRRILYDTSDGNLSCAFPAPHPVTTADNPLSDDIPIPGFGNLSDIQDAVGVYHHKFQVISLANDQLVGYLGGIDINDDRLDSPGHHSAAYQDPGDNSAPRADTYHDVHARITGPAAREIGAMFEDRYNHALSFDTPDIISEPLYDKPVPDRPPAFPTPAQGTQALAGQHLIRIAQTSFKPAPGRTGFPWAPDGDAPIRETFERAIRAARECIYIEEQYFTLDDDLIQVLRDAADHCHRLVIVVAANTSDQFSGNQRRLATFERLSGSTGPPGGGWGDRMIAGAPVRRSVLPAAPFTASKGRASLVEAIDTATSDKIYVAPVTRVPSDAPYFFWIGGELMFATKARRVTSPSGKNAVELDVLRGSLNATQPPWCPHPRAHKINTPVTFSAPKSIFIHAKLLMVDDVFVAIGSSNWNRRGFYHDGEIDAFAIPDRLRASADNPALQLRTALWAEHLGLTPSMGRALLADPIDGYEWFHRSRYGGNRFTHYLELLASSGDLETLNDIAALKVMPEPLRRALITSAELLLDAHRSTIWNTLVDPTSSIDPNPTRGPGLI